MTSRNWAFVALGSNIGDRAGHLAFARRRLSGLPNTQLVAESCIEETAALGTLPQGAYLNQMVLLHTALDPHTLLAGCLDIERDAGRIRRERWAARTLDLDIVRFGDLVLDEPELRVPHPELPNRPFWQRELEELEPHVE